MITGIIKGREWNSFSWIKFLLEHGGLIFQQSFNDFNEIWFLDFFGHRDCRNAAFVGWDAQFAVKCEMFEIQNELILLSDTSLLRIECFEALIDVLSEARLVIEESVNHFHLLVVLLCHILYILFHLKKSIRLSRRWVSFDSIASFIFCSTILTLSHTFWLFSASFTILLNILFDVPLFFLGELGDAGGLGLRSVLFQSSGFKYQRVLKFTYFAFFWDNLGTSIYLSISGSFTL